MEEETQTSIEREDARAPSIDGPSAFRRSSVWAVVASYLAITAWLSFEVNLWRDEMYSLHTTAGSVGEAARQGIRFELQPPLYFATLAAWRTLDPSPFFARLLSSLFVAVAILAVATMARRLVPNAHPALCAAVLASHPLAIWAGTEIRVYGLAILLSALLTWAFFDAYWHPGRSRHARLIFVGLAVLSIHTQYYLGVLMVGFGAALLARRRREVMASYAFDMTIVAVLSLPLFFVTRTLLGTHAADLGPRLDFGTDTLRRVVGRFETYLFSFNQAIDEANWSLSAIRRARWGYRALLLGVMTVGLFRWRRRRTVSLGEARPLLIVVAVYAFFMASLFVSMGPLSVGERHTSGLLVPALLAMVSLPAFALGRIETLAWSALLISSNVAATALTQIVPRAKDCDCRRVATTLEAREVDREPILIFPSEDVMPLSLYYHGKNRLLPVPGPPSYESWDQRAFVIHSVDDVARVLDGDANDAVGLWVHTNVYGPGWGPDKLEAFLASRYRQDERLEFARGVVLRHFVADGTASR